MGMMTSTIKRKIDDVTQCKMLMGHLTTAHKVRVNFFLPESRVIKIMMLGCHVDNCAQIKYDMILRS